MSRENDYWGSGGGCGQHGQRAHRGSYDEYDHSDEELYVYDQSCRNCRFYNSSEFYCTRNFGGGFRDGSGWCLNWKGKRGCR